MRQPKYPGCSLSGPSQEPSVTHQGIKPTAVIQLERLPGAAYKQRDVAAYGHLGLLTECKGSIHYEMFREGTTGRESEGARWLAGGQA